MADDYLAWPRDRAEALAKSTRAKDSAGQTWWDTRGTRTERSARYKVVATWMTPEVIRATARVLQLRDGLSAEATKALVAEADRRGSDDRDGRDRSSRRIGRDSTRLAGLSGPIRGGKGIDGSGRRDRHARACETCARSAASTGETTPTTVSGWSSR